LFKLLANFALKETGGIMTKSELIERLASQQSHIPAKAVEDAVKEMLEHMASTLAQGERIEIRGFGSFSLHYRAPRTGRNPKTGDKVELEGKYVPHFKPGKNYATAPIFTKSKFARRATCLTIKKHLRVLFLCPPFVRLAKKACLTATRRLSGSARAA
jgi:integration host factor subunit beta